MNDTNGKHLITQTLKEYALRELPDNPDPWPEVRQIALSRVAHRVQKQPMLANATQQNERAMVSPTWLSTSAQRMNFSVVMIVLVLAAAAVFALLTMRGGQSVDPVPAAVVRNGLPSEVPARTPTAEVMQAEQMIGLVAPDVSLTNVRTGGELKLSTFHGKALLLTMWFTRCPSCRTLISNMQQVYNKYSDKVEFVSISFGPSDTSAGVKAFIERNNYAWTFLHASDVEMIPYPVQAAPTLYFIGSDGIIHDTYVGEMDLATLTSKLESDLTNRSNPTSVP